MMTRRRIKLGLLYETLKDEERNNGLGGLEPNIARERARHILEHPSTRTMNDYFRDMEESRWIMIDKDTGYIHCVREADFGDRKPVEKKE